MGLRRQSQQGVLRSFQTTGERSQVHQKCDRHAFDSRRVPFFLLFLLFWVSLGRAFTATCETVRHCIRPVQRTRPLFFLLFLPNKVIRETGL